MMLRFVFPILCGLLFGCVQAKQAKVKDEPTRPNIIFISIDDLNDWNTINGGYDGKVHTPNMERLARLGVNFTNAHVPSPSCNPSRTAVFTGLMPSTTGIYTNKAPWIPHLPETQSIPQHFMANGYYVAGGGKNFHNYHPANPPSAWDEYFDLLILRRSVNFPPGLSRQRSCGARRGTRL